MWRPAGRKKTHSLVYTTVNHTHTHSNVRLASLLCAFVKDLSPFRVHVEFGDPFPRRCSAMCAYAILHGFTIFFLGFFLLFTSPYTVCYMRCTLLGCNGNIIAWNFLIVPYTTVLYTQRNRISHSPARSRVCLTPCERPIISPKHCVEAVNIPLGSEKNRRKNSQNIGRKMLWLFTRAPLVSYIYIYTIHYYTIYNVPYICRNCKSCSSFSGKLLQSIHNISIPATVFLTKSHGCIRWSYTARFDP